MLTLNPFDGDAFTLQSLTNAINILPNNYGRLREMNLFPGRGVRTRSVMIEERNGVLNLLPTKQVGEPGTQNKQGKRKVRSFAIPHIPLDDVVLPDEYDGIRAFGTENQMETLASIMNQHLQTAKNKFAITIEHLRMGALKGKILDSDGSELFDLFSEFGVSEKVVDFKFGTDTTNIQKKCFEVTRHIEDNLKGEVMTNVHCLVDGDFFDALISHPNVKSVYEGHVAAVQTLGGDPRKGFRFGGITFEEYRGTATDADGNTRNFLDTKTGRAFPQGTMNMFETLYAPADFLETVNTLGRELYAKQEPRQFNRGIDMHIQSNPLPICYRPNCCVKLTSSN